LRNALTPVAPKITLPEHIPTGSLAFDVIQLGNRDDVDARPVFYNNAFGKLAFSAS